MSSAEDGREAGEQRPRRCASELPRCASQPPAGPRPQVARGSLRAPAHRGRTRWGGTDRRPWPGTGRGGPLAPRAESGARTLGSSAPRARGRLAPPVPASQEQKLSLRESQRQKPRGTRGGTGHFPRRAPGASVSVILAQGAGCRSHFPRFRRAGGREGPGGKRPRRDGAGRPARARAGAPSAAPPGQAQAVPPEPLKHAAQAVGAVSPRRRPRAVTAQPGEAPGTRRSPACARSRRRGEPPGRVRC